MNRSRLTGFAVAGLVLLAACSSGSDEPTGDAADITVGVTAGAPAPGSAAPAESVPPGTDPPATEAPTTEASTTTEPVGNPEGTDPLPPLADDVALPIVFVHGFAGSAQQYESQKMRFVANGYPAERIVAFEHDGAGMDIAGYAAGAAAVIDEVLAEFGVEQVYLVGHSRGTRVSDTLLADPAQAPKIAKYLAIDGAPCPAMIAVPCLAPNQELLPGQAHVETATSKESFAMQYEFLVGAAPEAVDIVPQRDPIEISGRAVNFPANTGREGVTLEIWAVDADTGVRTAAAPIASNVLPADGSFGPVEVEFGQHYEYVLTAPDSPSQHHLYLQPYVRSSDFVRLLSSPADGTTRVNTNTGDRPSSIIAMRMREWYAVDDTDLDGDQRDALFFSTDGGEAVDALATFVGNSAIGIHVHDDLATPGATTLLPLPYFSEQPFQSGVDVFLPAAPGGSGTIRIESVPRGDTSRPQVLNVPNWPSSTHAISVVFTDYPM
jgi:pimeloyl-ACP methyl ester carboxylesterase